MNGILRDQKALARIPIEAEMDLSWGDIKRFLGTSVIRGSVIGKMVGQLAIWQRMDSVKVLWWVDGIHISELQVFFNRLYLDLNLFVVGTGYRLSIKVLTLKISYYFILFLNGLLLCKQVIIYLLNIWILTFTICYYFILFVGGLIYSR